MLQRCDQSLAWVSGSAVVAVTAGRLPSASVGQKTEIGQGLTVFIGSPESRCFKRHCVNGFTAPTLALPQVGSAKRAGCLPKAKRAGEEASTL